MKKNLLIIVFFFLFSMFHANGNAQCSVCAKTPEQAGEKFGKGLNNAIYYLAAIPFLTAGFIGYRWWKSNRGV
jgi:hypothetical protein